MQAKKQLKGNRQEGCRVVQIENAGRKVCQLGLHCGVTFFPFMTGEAKLITLLTDCAIKTTLS